jgi:hypothetical protein
LCKNLGYDTLKVDKEYEDESNSILEYNNLNNSNNTSNTFGTLNIPVKGIESFNRLNTLFANQRGEDVVYESVCTQL